MIDQTKLIRGLDNMNLDHLRQVRYVSSGGEKVEFGYITGWNLKFIFVRYHFQTSPKIMPLFGRTSQPTSPQDLSWAE